MASLINQAAASVGIPAGLNRTVVVSGTTGFIGTEVALAYAQYGYYVHATARSQDKADAWLKAHPIAANRVKFFIVKDVADEGAFDEALQGVDTVAHTGKLPVELGDPHHTDVLSASSVSVSLQCT